jgi:Putative prokaryotic signal transducing protein
VSNTRTFEGWVSAFRSGTDYEADLVRDRLDDSGISAVVLTQRDHSFNLNHGDLALVNVMVPRDELKAAMEILTAEPLTDSELAEVALRSDPNSPPGEQETDA